MTAVLKIKPAPGLKVRDPVTKQHLKEEGEQKPRTTFWLRRLAAGEVLEVKSDAVKAAGSDEPAAAQAGTKKGGR